ncbi:MAG: hypothetical protein CVV44_04090 [Spirochaetae bacterium HGW-Spirochaetae-1]|jgi:hypothetical protein|nr:MAG: hypothetical protein CVV44_04090 [Spirochaetae bacterium HGW-Spirochaetae-1]
MNIEEREKSMFELLRMASLRLGSGHPILAGSLAHREIDTVLEAVTAARREEAGSGNAVRGASGAIVRV